MRITFENLGYKAATFSVICFQLTEDKLHGSPWGEKSLQDSTGFCILYCKQQLNTTLGSLKRRRKKKRKKENKREPLQLHNGGKSILYF